MKSKKDNFSYKIHNDWSQWLIKQQVTQSFNSNVKNYYLLMDISITQKLVHSSNKKG